MIVPRRPVCFLGVVLLAFVTLLPGRRAGNRGDIPGDVSAPVGTGRSSSRPRIELPSRPGASREGSRSGSGPIPARRA